MPTDIDDFYGKVFGKESALFLGTLWLGMIAKHMDEVRKAEDEAFEFMDVHIMKWLNKLRVLYDNVEFKTDIPRYKDEADFYCLVFNQIEQKYVNQYVKIPKSKIFVMWFEKIKNMYEISERINDEKSKLKKQHLILIELGNCQRDFYKEIEKKHLIMPPEKEDMKDITRNQWIDRDKKKDLYGDYSEYEQR